MLRLTWLAPTSNGGSAVTDYIIQRSPNGTTGWATISDGVNTNTTYTATGLVNGTRYYFRVCAHNAVGNSPTSNVANAVPVPVPTGAALVDGGADERVGSGPSDLAGADVERRVGGHRLHHPTLTERHHRLDDDQRRRQHHDRRTPSTGLVNGTRYYFRVFAHNAVGNGPVSNVANAIPRTLPTAARSLTAAPTNLSGQVRLTWLAPTSNGGSAVTDYIVQRSPNGTTGWATISDGVNTNTTYTVAGLVNGTRYYFRVYAHNAAGNGADQQRRQRHPAHGARTGVVLLGHRVLRGFRPLLGRPGRAPVDHRSRASSSWRTTTTPTRGSCSMATSTPRGGTGSSMHPARAAGCFRSRRANAAGVGPFSAPVEACYP